MTTLRLLKVIVQPIFVLDDGEQLTEQTVEPIAVSAAEWPTYATTGFAEAFAVLRRRYDVSQVPPSDTE